MYAELANTQKRAINQNSALSGNCRLSNDVVMHKAVEEEFHGVMQVEIAAQVRIPRLDSYVSRNDRVCWSMHTKVFPRGEQAPEDLLISECIPVHLAARHALIDLYFSGDLKTRARRQDSNDDCLVRLYLGKRQDRTNRFRPRKFFSLRSLTLCLDQMQDLGLDTTQYALAMPEALAVIHWKAKIDAAGVEFVLGGPPCLTHFPVPSSQQILELQGRACISTTMSHSVSGAMHKWLLDFNQCQRLSINESGIDQAVKRFLDNDPYYPRPPMDPNLDVWEAFRLQYLAISQRLLDGKHQTLPALFLHRASLAHLERLRIKAEAASRSDEYTRFEASRG